MSFPSPCVQPSGETIILLHCSGDNQPKHMDVQAVGTPSKSRQLARGQRPPTQDVFPHGLVRRLSVCAAASVHSRTLGKDQRHFRGLCALLWKQHIFVCMDVRGDSGDGFPVSWHALCANLNIPSTLQISSAKNDPSPTDGHCFGNGTHARPSATHHTSVRGR